MTAKLVNKLIGLGFESEKAKALDDRFDAIAIKTIFVPAGLGKAGATAGFTTATNNGTATCAATITSGTFTLPIIGLVAGDIISAFKVIAQIESAGGAVTLDATLRYTTNVAADPTDTSLGGITQISVSADTASAVSKTLATAYTVTSGQSVYALLTATTAGSTDIQVLGVEVTVVSAQE